MAAVSLNSVTTQCDGTLHHQRMGELALAAHAVRRNCAAMGRHKVHQTKTERLHARLRGNVKRAMNRSGRLNQYMEGQLFGAGLNQGLLGQLHIGH
jgi:hypothetical protein